MATRVFLKPRYIRLFGTTALSLALGLSFTPTAESVEYKIMNSKEVARLPIQGNPCKTLGEFKKTPFYSYECVKAINGMTWKVTGLEYATPDIFKKGFEIGKKLKKANPSAGNIATQFLCRRTAYGDVIKNLEIQNGSVSKSDKKVLEDYFGYIGCWQGFEKGGNPPKTLKDWSQPVGIEYTSSNGLSYAPLWSWLNQSAEAIVLAFRNAGTEEELKAAFVEMRTNLYEDPIDEGMWSRCVEWRVSDGWRIESIFIDPTAIVYQPDADNSTIIKPEDMDPEYPTERSGSATPYKSVPVLAYVYFLYFDDVNGYTAERAWKRFVFSPNDTDIGSNSPFKANFSICPTKQQEQSIGLFDEDGWEFQLPRAFSLPKGKVDKKSNAYKFMFNVGRNFAKASLPTDSGIEQCKSAMISGLIKVRGVPQYLGIQAQQIQSYLKTASGFQGCLDGFGK